MISKEAIAGVAIIIVIMVVVFATTGIYGLAYIGIAFVLVIISINLFSRKSIRAKTGAVIINPDLIFKILLPKKYKKAIKDLEKKSKADE